MRQAKESSCTSSSSQT